jgi:hypothetical protein
MFTVHILNRALNLEHRLTTLGLHSLQAKFIYGAALERFVWPAPGLQTLAIAALGIGPLGFAFYVWDYGCKQGDLRFLCVFAYFALLLSTALLTLSGLAPANAAARPAKRRT